MKKSQFMIFTTIILGFLSLVACNTTAEMTKQVQPKPTPAGLTSVWNSWNAIYPNQNPNWGDFRSVSWKPDSSQVLISASNALIDMPVQATQAIQQRAVRSREAYWNPSGTKIATVSELGIVERQDIATNTYSGLEQGINSDFFQWSPNGLLGAGKTTEDGVTSTIIWNMTTGAILHRIGTIAYVSFVQFSHDNTKILIIGNNEALVYSFETQSTIFSKSGTGSWSSRLEQGAFTLDNQNVILSGEGGYTSTLETYDLATGTLQQTKSFSYAQSGSKPWLRADGKKLIIIGYSVTKIHDLETGTATTTALQRGGEPDPTGTWVVQDDSMYINGVNYETVRIYDILTGQLQREIKWERNFVPKPPPQPRVNNVYGLAYDHDGKLLEVGRNTKNIIRSANGAYVLSEFTGHTDSIYGVAYNPDSSRFMTGSSDGTAIIWDASTTPPTPIQTLSSHTYTVRGVAWGANTIATASWDSSAKLWKADTFEEIATIQHNDFVNAVAFNPDSTQIATGSSDRTLKISSSTDGSQIRSIAVPAAVLSLNWNSDGTQIAVGTTDKNTYVFDVSTGALIKTFTGHTGAVRAVLWSKDNSALITASDDSTVKLWNASSGEEITSVKPVSGYAVFALALSPDGKTVVAGSAAGPTVAYTLE